MFITGYILRVNLSTRNITKTKMSHETYRKYFGGRGLIVKYLLKELKPRIDPLGPENKLIFAAGLLTGSGLPGTGRNSVGAKSPLTGGYGDSEAGGFWGVELKKAGFDAIIIEGVSPSPVYLWIKDGQVEILEAEHIWGKKTAEADKLIKRELGDQHIKIAQIGVAGENLVRYANIAHDLTHFAGRCGLGAVMGSKRLRAIAVRGTAAKNIFNPIRIKELSKWLMQNYKEKASLFHNLGTSGLVSILNEMGGLPTRNFTSGTFEGADRISGETLKKTIYIKSETCHSCPIRCKRVVAAKEPYSIDPSYGGPEYESIASFGSLLGIDDLAAVAKANELCNSYGIDTISTGASIAFAMECFEKGIITRKDTGFQLRFGNTKAMLGVIEHIVHKKGIGKLLSEGVKRASQVIGRETSHFALHVKGQELPMHEPRLKSGLGLGYMVSPTGADHCHNIHDTYFNVTVDSVEPLGILNPIPLDDIGEDKMRLLAYYGNWRHFGNCALCCIFVPWSFRHMVSAVEAVTGWSTSLLELLKVGERAVNLCRIFNVREGFGREDDMLPNRWYEDTFGEGPLKGVTFVKKDLEDARQTYYGIMGWDTNGVPIPGKLADLDISWALPYVYRHYNNKALLPVDYS